MMTRASVARPVRNFERCKATAWQLAGHVPAQAARSLLPPSPMVLSRFVTHLLFAGATMVGAQLTACSGHRLPRPERTEGERAQTDKTAVLATHPPPAALPEIVSERPSERAQWLPGDWIWRRNSWVWQRGGWIENPERLRLVDSQVRYTKDGTLEYCPRRWVNAEGEEREAPQVVAPAATPPIPELREEQTVP